MRHIGRGAVTAALVAGGLLFVVVVRLHARHRGLLYPDGYQYLLMARGVSEHLRPVTQLGPRGAPFVPSVDAALKPLFPALVGALSALGIPLRTAADAVSAAASVAVVALVGAITFRFTRSLLAAVVAAAAALTSSAVAYWAGFTGPDQLGVALALSCALLLADGRATTGGVLAALAISSRPELLLIAVGAAVAAALSPKLRDQVFTASTACALTIGLLLLVVRPPLALPARAGLVPLAVIGCAALFVVAAHAARRRGGTCALMLALGCGLVLLAALKQAHGASQLGRSEWPLLVAAALGLAVAGAGAARGRRFESLTLLVAVVTLAIAYLVKNPNSERYLTLLIPAACIALGFAIADGRRWIVLPALCLAFLNPLLSPDRPTVGADAFQSLAPRLAAALPRGPLVSAAPDAFAILLPDRAQQALRVGARGLVLIDGAARSYQPGLAARGRVILRVLPPGGFVRPDGSIDRGPATVVEGVAVRGRGGG